MAQRRISSSSRRREKQGAFEEEGRFAYEGLDRLLHEKARLSILATLTTRPDGVLFGELKALCRLTDGNLSRHLELLREAGLVEIWKGFDNKRPQTLCRLTPVGRGRFLAYLREVERVLQDALPRAERARPRDAAARDLTGMGWIPV